MSTTATRPIKVADTAPGDVSNTRSVVNEIKSPETGKVTAVAAVMTVFKKNKGSSRSTTTKGKKQLGSSWTQDPVGTSFLLEKEPLSTYTG